jgi:hypothetical protein
MDLLGRGLGIIFLFAINSFVLLVVGYLYITEKYYLASND